MTLNQQSQERFTPSPLKDFSVISKMSRSLDRSASPLRRRRPSIMTLDSEKSRPPSGYAIDFKTRKPSVENIKNLLVDEVIAK